MLHGLVLRVSPKRRVVPIATKGIAMIGANSLRTATPETASESESPCVTGGSRETGYRNVPQGVNSEKRTYRDLASVHAEPT